ncbi:hypothetical protein [Ekhidna sp.]|uniref:hypothetical protein n=1 Tax=Ekhidna sp. TaxID=2608089 RepID=UPI003C7AC407
MGYHVILKHDSNGLESRYAENLEELSELPIEKNTIIYQGEKHWTPILAKNDEKYCFWTDIRFRLSKKAEFIFRDQASKEKYMIETINQDQESFSFYTGVSEKYIDVKRGDFLIRNVGNLEVEVKCKTFYNNNGERHFYFEKEALKKHENMQKFTGTHVVIAVYQRKEEKVKEDSLYMISVNHMRYVIDQLAIKPLKRVWGWGFPIPIKHCAPKFGLIETYKREINERLGQN